MIHSVRAVLTTGTSSVMWLASFHSTGNGVLVDTDYIGILSVASIVTDIVYPEILLDRSYFAMI